LLRNAIKKQPRRKKQRFFPNWWPTVATIELSEFYENLNPLEMKRKINKLTEKLNKTIVTKIHDLMN